MCAIVRSLGARELLRLRLHQCLEVVGARLAGIERQARPLLLEGRRLQSGPSLEDLKARDRRLGRRSADGLDSQVKVCLCSQGPECAIAEEQFLLSVVPRTIELAIRKIALEGIHFGLWHLDSG